MDDLDLVWLRPWGGLVLAPWLGAFWWWFRSSRGTGPWQRHIDADLIEHVTVPGPRTAHRSLIVLWMVLGVLVVTALAGPSWNTRSVPVFRDLSARVVVLDLSPSMMSVDATPNRLALARSIVTDLLRDAAGRQLGLVVFAGDAFTVAPLTRDAATLLHLLHSVDETTLPRPGSRVDLGLHQAAKLLEAADVARGDVYLVGDSAGDERARSAARALQDSGFPLSVVAVGTPEGGPVRLPDGRLAMEAGEVVVTRLDPEALNQLADAGNGSFAMAHDLRTFRTLADTGPRVRPNTGKSLQARELPADGGHWFALLALPVFMLLCRRGWLLSVALAGSLVALPHDEARALDWQDWWARPDQQAATVYSTRPDAVDPALEGKLAELPEWRAIVLARSGRLDEAVRLLSAFDTPTAHYNRGNALAMIGDLERALQAYDTTLALESDHVDASFNRALVRQALARQREQRNQGQGQASNPPRPEGTDDRTPQGDRQAPSSSRPEQQSSTATSRASHAPEQSRADGRQAARAQEDARAAARARAGVTGAELRRLEGLLAQVPDEPGSLLKNRFAIEFKLRSYNSRDTGPQW